MPGIKNPLQKAFSAPFVKDLFFFLYLQFNEGFEYTGITCELLRYSRIVCICGHTA
jgi:hypothetical protein